MDPLRDLAGGRRGGDGESSPRKKASSWARLRASVLVAVRTATPRCSARHGLGDRQALGAAGQAFNGESVRSLPQPCRQIAQRAALGGGLEQSLQMEHDLSCTGNRDRRSQKSGARSQEKNVLTFDRGDGGTVGNSAAPCSNHAATNRIRYSDSRLLTPDSCFLTPDSSFLTPDFLSDDSMPVPAFPNRAKTRLMIELVEVPSTIGMLRTVPPAFSTAGGSTMSEIPQSAPLTRTSGTIASMTF